MLPSHQHLFCVHICHSCSPLPRKPLGRQGPRQAAPGELLDGAGAPMPHWMPHPRFTTYTLDCSFKSIPLLGGARATKISVCFLMPQGKRLQHLNLGAGSCWLQLPPAFAAKAEVNTWGGKCQQMAPAASAAQHALAAASHTASGTRPHPAQHPTALLPWAPG